MSKTQEYNLAMQEEDARIGEIRANRIDARNQEHIVRTFSILDKKTEKEREDFFEKFPLYKNQGDETRDDVIKRLVKLMREEKK